MKVIIICLLIILVCSGYLAITQDKRFVEVGKVQTIKQTTQTNDDYIIEITEEEDDE